MPADWHSIRADWRGRRDPPSFLCIPDPPRIAPMHQPRTVPRWLLTAAALVAIVSCAFGAGLALSAWLSMRHVIQ